MHTTNSQLDYLQQSRHLQQLGHKAVGQTLNLKPLKLKTGLTVIGAILCLSLSACGTMTNRGKSTAIGAGVGAVAGAVLTGGSAWGTVGGAAVGGVVGNQIGK